MMAGRLSPTDDGIRGGGWLATASPALHQTMGNGAAIGLAVASSFEGGGYAGPSAYALRDGSDSLPAGYVSRVECRVGFAAATVIGIFLFFIGLGLQ
jgi:hypothetical protein